MTTYAGDLKWYTLAKAILTYVNANTTSTFARVAVVPGLIAWDECDCGMLALYVNQTYASDNFPMQKIERDISDGCGALYEASEFVLHVVECAPSPQGQDNAPTTDAEEAAARLVRRDAREVYRAVNGFLCQARADGDIEDFVVDTQIIQGPTGGCVGTELRWRIALDWS
jgi:hypothetical protein